MHTVPQGCDRRVQQGFALIEWLLALAIATSLVAMAAGSWRRWWVGIALSQAEHAMLASFAIARHEAVRQNRPVTLCPATAEGQCASTPHRDGFGAHSSGREWRFGWLVVVDRPVRREKSARVRQGEPQGAPMVLHRVDPIGGIRVSVHKSAGPLVFRPPMGLIVARWGGFEIRPENMPTGQSASAEGLLAMRCLTLSGNGRARVARGPCR
ncbi:GspH/FimT family pseudopilin [Robbsia sp. KACC 23696]|uniref:GspH/FimT family pseudopilin n=1 Tax=Robbsia sp. KACC 23696 TaxID=3149231 RepID=UPI00325A553A